MRRFSISCRNYRQRLCLLATGDLPDQETVEVEPHLADCAGCRRHYEQLRSAAAQLAGWERAFAHIEADQALRARWAKEFESSLAPARAARFAHLSLFLDWCHDMVWPCRRAWAGFAAVWVAIIALNLSTRDQAQSLAQKSTRPSPEMLRAFLEREGLLAELAKPKRGQDAKPPKSPAPAPRSERRPGISRA